MAVELFPVLQMATHALPWFAAIYCMIRCLALAATYVMAVVALFHRAPQRRHDAQAVLARHPFTRRR